MDIDTSNNWKNGLPVEFSQLLERFGYPSQIRDYNAKELIAIWRGAISAYKSNPDSSNEIAIHTMSIGWESELTETDDKFADIYFTFGELERPARISDEYAWKQLERGIEDLAT